MSNAFIVSTESSLYLAELIADKLELPIVDIVRKTFGGGEKHNQVAIKDRMDLLGKTAIVVGSTHTDEDLLELHRVGCALAGYGCVRRIFCIPFLGYSTMERAVKAGEVVTVKPIARQLSGIPNTQLGNTFLFLDLHVSGLVHYFEGDCLRFELYAEKQLRKIIERLGLRNFMFASADLGRPAWVRSFAQYFGTKIALIDKIRHEEKTEVEYVIGDVKGKEVVIYDDMTRSAGTVIKAADAYLSDGATAVDAVFSHLALNDESVAEKLLASRIRRIIFSNSHPSTQLPIVQLSDRFIEVDVSGIYAEAIKKFL